MELDAKTDICCRASHFRMSLLERIILGDSSLFTDGQEEGESMARKMISAQLKSNTIQDGLRFGTFQKR